MEMKAEESASLFKHNSTSLSGLPSTYVIDTVIPTFHSISRSRARLSFASGPQVNKYFFTLKPSVNEIMEANDLTVR